MLPPNRALLLPGGLRSRKSPEPELLLTYVHLWFNREGVEVPWQHEVFVGRELGAA